MSILPPTWLLKPINEVFEINPRVFCALSTARDLPVHFVPMKAVTEDSGGINIEEVRPLSQVMRGYTAFTEGDVIFAKITPCMENGKVAVVPKLKYQIAYGSTEFHVLRATGLVNPYWVARYLSQVSVRRAAKRNMTGSAGQLRVPAEWFSTFEIPIPPLPEQERISTALQRLLAELDVAVSKLERIKSNLKRYRASVLQAAVEGRLTAEWRKEHPPSETGAELLTSLLKERRAKWEENQLKKYAEQGKTPPKDWKGKYPEPVKPDTTGLPELPEGWVWGTMDIIGKIKGGLTKNQRRLSLPFQLPYLRVENVYLNELRLNDVGLIGLEENELEKVLLRKGDLLIVEGNGSPDQIGRLAIWDGSIENCVHQNHLIKVRLYENLQPKLVVFWFSSTAGRNCITEVSSSTSGLYTLSVGKVAALPLPLPPLDEQHEIILEVESRLTIADSAEKTIENNLKRAISLRQSILKRAFEGRLVPQDPNDEPASMLLERIRAERAEQAATMKPARTRQKRKGDAKRNLNR